MECVPSPAKTAGDVFFHCMAFNRFTSRKRKHWYQTFWRNKAKYRFAFLALLSTFS